jgi:GcrA cell cycle regulator
MRDFWTTERVERLRKLWAEGQTATAIAASLGGSSRAGVLGKIFRLRLASPNVAASDPAAADAQQPGHRRPGRPPAPKPQVAATPPKRGKSLLELTNESCRWPHGEPGTARFHFCGAPGADLQRGMPYCERHAQRAYHGDGDTSEGLLTATKPGRAPPRPKSLSAPSIVPTRPQRIVAHWRGRF